MIHHHLFHRHLSPDDSIALIGLEGNMVACNKWSQTGNSFLSKLKLPPCCIATNLAHKSIHFLRAHFQMNFSSQVFNNAVRLLHKRPTVSKSTYCQSSWCPPRSLAVGWIQLSASGDHSSPGQGRNYASLPQWPHLEKEVIKLKYGHRGPQTWVWACLIPSQTLCCTEAPWGICCHDLVLYK